MLPDCWPHFHLSANRDYIIQPIFRDNMARRVLHSRPGFRYLSVVIKILHDTVLVMIPHTGQNFFLHHQSTFHSKNSNHHALHYVSTDSGSVTYNYTFDNYLDK